MLNEVNLMGRLTKDPELRRTESGVAVTSFRIAVERDTRMPKDLKPISSTALRGEALLSSLRSSLQKGE